MVTFPVGVLTTVVSKGALVAVATRVSWLILRWSLKCCAVLPTYCTATLCLLLMAYSVTRLNCVSTRGFRTSHVVKLTLGVAPVVANPFVTAKGEPLDVVVGAVAV